MGVFKKSSIKSEFEYNRSFNFTKQLKPTSFEKNGVVINYVSLEDVDISKENIMMPTKEEFDLEQQLKSGYVPQQINVRGILPNENGQFDAISAFNSLQSQIDSISKADNSVNNDNTTES